MGPFRLAGHGLVSLSGFARMIWAPGDEVTPCRWIALQKLHACIADG